MVLLRLFVYSIVILLVAVSCRSNVQKSTLEVTATAYNSHASQTLGDPNITAWGDTLKPGMKAIAVSRDLIDSGLTYGTMVKINGLPGKYRVIDKMHRRWNKKIDIYMGVEIDTARAWGKRQVTISWKNKPKN